MRWYEKGHQSHQAPAADESKYFPHHCSGFNFLQYCTGAVFFRVWSDKVFLDDGYNGDEKEDPSGQRLKEDQKQRTYSM